MVSCGAYVVTRLLVSETTLLARVGRVGTRLMTGKQEAEQDVSGSH
jgi:hypothetical protein